VSTALASFTSTGSGGPQSITLQLQPAELGRVQINIARNADGSASVTVTAERAETLALLQGDQLQLQRSLDQAGLPTEGRSLSFQLAEPNGVTGSADAGSALPAAASSSPGGSGGAGFGQSGAGQGGAGQHGQGQAALGSGSGTAGQAGGDLGAQRGGGQAAMGQLGNGGLGAGGQERGQGGGNAWSAQTPSSYASDAAVDAVGSAAAADVMTTVQSLGVDIVA